MVAERIGELECLDPGVGSVQRPKHLDRVVAVQVSGEDDLVLGGNRLEHGRKARYQLRDVPCLVPDRDHDREPAHHAPFGRAGLPTTTALASTSRVTTAPAPTIASSPTSMSGSRVALAPT